MDWHRVIPRVSKKRVLFVIAFFAIISYFYLRSLSVFHSMPGMTRSPRGLTETREAESSMRFTIKENRTAIPAPYSYLEAAAGMEPAAAQSSAVQSPSTKDHAADPAVLLKDKPQASAYPTDDSALQLIPVSGGHPKFEHCVLQDTPIEALSAQDSNGAGCGPNGKVYLHALHFGRGRANLECVADVDFGLFVSCWLAWRHVRPKGIWHYISVSSYSLLFACRRTLRRPD